MGVSFFKYIQRLELIGFFSGYSLLFVVVLVIAGNHPTNYFKQRLISVLPVSYALVGTLYLGLQIKNFYQSQHILQQIYDPYLMAWALLSISFWIPLFRKKVLLSLLHSLVFFFLLAKDIFMLASASVDGDTLKNDMKIYTVSLLLNLACFIVLLIFSFVALQIKKRRIGEL